MNEKLTVKDITPQVKSTVSDYLAARAAAETMRSAVDKIQREILADIILTGQRQDRTERIFEPKFDYLCENQDELNRYYQECDARLRSAGLKPADMQFDFCPALVAERVKIEAEWAILDAAADMLELEFDGKELNHRLLCMGLEKRQEFLDLVVGLVVNVPGFQIPFK